jgi:hypothetical protein
LHSMNRIGSNQTSYSTSCKGHFARVCAANRQPPEQWIEAERIKVTAIETSCLSQELGAAPFKQEQCLVADPARH